MRRIKVKVVVDPDVEKKYSIPLGQIEFYVVTYLNDPDGWSKKGYFFEPVSFNQDVTIHLSSQPTIDKECGLDGKLSCAELGGKKVWLNSERWYHGATKSKLSLDNYRQYMVSHEIGHILGFDHTQCPCKNCPAPIMMQQTKGIGQCKPNTTV
jgi:Protein of unknown function (DUF3152)